MKRQKPQQEHQALQPLVFTRADPAALASFDPQCEPPAVEDSPPAALRARRTEPGRD